MIADDHDDFPPFDVNALIPKESNSIVKTKRKRAPSIDYGNADPNTGVGKRVVKRAKTFGELEWGKGGGKSLEKEEEENRSDVESKEKAGKKGGLKARSSVRGKARG